MNATIEGAEVVIVSAGEYTHLTNGLPPPTRSARAIMDHMIAKPGRKSPFVYDREVALFLIERIGTKTDLHIREECVERFGMERSPSRASMCRFAQAVRAFQRTQRNGALDMLPMKACR